MTVQRNVLLMVTAAYRTVSHEALWLIAGVQAIYLSVEWILWGERMFGTVQTKVRVGRLGERRCCMDDREGGMIARKEE